MTKKDSNNSLIGKREGILSLHPSIVVEVVRLIRSLIKPINVQRKQGVVMEENQNR
jgi:hypothetical protein